MLESILIVFALFALIVIVILPYLIAKNRKISESNLSTIRLLTFLGLFIPFFLIAALIMACVYPENHQPIKKKFKTTKNNNDDFDWNNIAD